MADEQAERQESNTSSSDANVESCEYCDRAWVIRVIVREPNGTRLESRCQIHAIPGKLPKAIKSQVVCRQRRRFAAG